MSPNEPHSARPRYFGRKNLIVSWGGTVGSNTSGSPVQAIDPHTGITIWQAPAVHGQVSPNSLSFSDVYGDGTLHMVFGTAEAMYITQ